MCVWRSYGAKFNTRFPLFSALGCSCLFLSLSLSQVSFFVLLWLFFLALGPVGRSFSFCVAQNFEVGGYAPIDISFRSVPSIHFITVAICLIRRVDDGQLVSMETDALVVRD